MKGSLSIVAAVVGLLLASLPPLNAQYAADYPFLNFRVEENFFRTPPWFNFGEVAGVAVDPRGHIFVFNRGVHSLVEFDAKGRFLRTLGDGLFESPHGLRFDPQGNLWTTDTASHLVLRFNRKGHVTMVLGRKGRSGETETLFNQPTDVAFGPNGELFVADGYGNSRIVKFDRNGNFIKAWGQRGSGPGEFNLPHTIVVDPRDRVLVGDRENQRIQIFDLDGTFIEEWSHAGAPWGLTLGRDGTLWMADGYADRVLKLDLDGKVLGVFGSHGKIAGKFAFAHSIAVGAKNELYVAEILNWRVQKIVPAD